MSDGMVEIKNELGAERREGIPGIIIHRGKGAALGGPRSPRIQAFVWGGKVRPSPILPYGRWKGAA